MLIIFKKKCFRQQAIHLQFKLSENVVDIQFTVYCIFYSHYWLLLNHLYSHSAPTASQSTMNIFGSKSGHLHNRKKLQSFLHFPKCLQYLMIFSNFTEHLALSTFKNHQRQKFFLKKNLPIIPLLKWPLFEPKMFIEQSWIFKDTTFFYFSAIWYTHTN